MNFQTSIWDVISWITGRDRLFVDDLVLPFKKDNQILVFFIYI